MTIDARACGATLVGMPMYEYRCRACGHTFDRLRSLSEADDATACPSCQGVDAARLPSRIAARTSVGGSSAGGSSLPMAGGSAPSAGGGCCGGGCCS